MGRQQRITGHPLLPRYWDKLPLIVTNFAALWPGIVNLI
ncbi:hypothetical protein BN129_4041 [Cronobacter sakazakii 701]|nr:hypothetical protein BN129_4041 [Cronobacter sakazakii 701]